MTFPQGATGFLNPVIGGDGLLIIDNIHSSNYSAGVSGWQINKDGSAEFNDATIRGDLDVTAPDGSFIRTYTAGGTAELREGPPTVGGVTWLPGSMFTFLDGVAPNQRPVTVLVSPADSAATSDRPSLHLLGPRAGITDFNSAVLYSDQVEIRGLSLPLIMEIFGDVIIDGSLELHSAASNQEGAVLVAGSAWTNLTMNAGYSYFGSGYVPQWRWMGPDTVQLRGVIKKGTGAGGAGVNGFASGDSALTLPAAIRPSEIINIPAPCQAIASNYGVVRVQVNPSGTIPVTVSAASNPGWIEIDTIYDIV